MKENKVPPKNAGDIYRQIYCTKTSSRNDLADKLNISLPTVTQSLKQLMEDKLIFNSGEFDSTGGRKASMYSVIPDAKLALGVDITQSYISMVLVDLNLNQLDKAKFQIPYENTDTYYQYIGNQIEELLERNTVKKQNFLGVGISLPVIVGKGRNSIDYASVIGVPDDLYERMGKWISYPFLFFNDANSAGWAELWTRGENQPMVYLSISNSVGGAMMLDGRVYTGSNWRGAEFGHMTIVPNGKKCYCGRYGCVDAYCSANILSDFTHGDLKLFFDILKSGENRGYQDIFDTYLDHLALTVNNLRMCFDCDVILGGNVGAYLEDYIDELREKARKLTPFENTGDYIKICSYRTEPSAVGAALYYIDKFIQSQ